MSVSVHLSFTSVSESVNYMCTMYIIVVSFLDATESVRPVVGP